jgi:arylsulfatase A-like enzyme
MSGAVKVDKPNIIWIMSDDLSWGDLGCYGQSLIQTPHIDRLAAAGMRFTQCHSGSTVCAPSRSTLMQGLHTGHATVRENMVHHSGGTYRHSLQPEDRTVAQMLQDAGYVTGMFGKWGLALSDQPGIPNDKGFDVFYGYLNQRKAHTYYPEYLWSNREQVHFPQHRGHDHRKPNAYDEDGRIILNGVADPGAAQYAFDLYVAESEQFVRDYHDRPFFLYLPYTPPHGALEVPDLGPYAHLDWPSLTHKLWAALITRMDDAVGRLMALLREYGILERTLVFFTSDNGYSGAGYAHDPSLDDFFHHRGPWKGQKGNLGQGGLRVPTIAAWEGQIEPGSRSDLPWAFWDLFPTAAEVVGLPPPEGIDGISVLPTLLGEPERQPQREFLYWEFNDEQALRLGERWVYRAHPAQPTEVYDAIRDPGQTEDLAEVEPDVVKRAELLFEQEHTATPYIREPGQSQDAWEKQLHERGIRLLDNVDD